MLHKFIGYARFKDPAGEAKPSEDVAEAEPSKDEEAQLSEDNEAEPPEDEMSEQEWPTHKIRAL